MYEKICELLAEKFDVDVSTLSENTSIKEDLKADELFYGPRLLENQNPVLLEYLQKQQNQNRMLIGQLSGNPGEKATQRLCELKEKEAILESALARFHTM